MAHAYCILVQAHIEIKLLSLASAHSKVGKSQVDQAYEVHNGEDDGSC